MCVYLRVFFQFHLLYYDVIRFQGGIFFARKVSSAAFAIPTYIRESETSSQSSAALTSKFGRTLPRNSYEKLDNESPVKDYLQKQQLERPRARVRRFGGVSDAPMAPGELVP